MKLIDEREEMAREREDLGFDLERANAELNLLRNQFEKSDAGKLTGQVANLKEESKELKNDFIIKMSSFTQEIDTLKSKLSIYEQGDISRTDQTVEEVKSPADGTRQMAASDLARNPSALETTRDYRAKYNLEDSLDVSRLAEDAVAARARGEQPSGIGAFVASLFLTESEMQGKNDE